MSKLFLSTSFSSQVDLETGEVHADFRKKIQAIIDELAGAGFKVFCAVEHEGWVINNQAPEIGINKDLEQIDSSDVFVALLHDSISAGVQFETGYAVGKGKKVFVTTACDDKLAYFNQGAATAGKVTHILYDDPKLLAQEVKTRVL
jgi:nucleoside 2-deoxyribosyltransferase